MNLLERKETENFDYEKPAIEIIEIEIEGVIAASDPTGTVPDMPWG